LATPAALREGDNIVVGGRLYQAPSKEHRCSPRDRSARGQSFTLQRIRLSSVRDKVVRTICSRQKRIPGGVNSPVARVRNVGATVLRAAGEGPRIWTSMEMNTSITWGVGPAILAMRRSVVAAVRDAATRD